MKEKQFNELLKSINEGGKILKGEKKPSREFNFEENKESRIKESKSKKLNNFSSYYTYISQNIYLPNI
jgi:uncharacterized alpha/beta hydrolase family protein